MKHQLLLLLTILLSPSWLFAQTLSSQADAAKTIQPSQGSTLNPTTTATELKIPAGTPIEVEVAYTVNSLDVKAGERISFRVLVPVMIDGVKAIDQGSLVTARITLAKRGGHWGKAGKLAWAMEDVVAIDNTRVPLEPDTASRKLWSLEKTGTNNGLAADAGHIAGTSHGGEVAAVSIASGVLFPPLALMGGFKRGENAVLREGRRFVVAVGKDTLVKTTALMAAP